MDTEKKLGRPPLPDNERLDEIVKVRLTAAEKEQVRLAAEIQGLSISDYVRQVILNASKGEIGINQGTLSKRVYLDFMTLFAEGRAVASCTGEPVETVDLADFLSKRDGPHHTYIEPHHSIIDHFELDDET